MAHYTLINKNNIVVQVITGVDENDTSNLPDEFESWEEFYSDQHNMTCKRTSYNTRQNQHINGGTAFRGNFAGIGFFYDEDNDVFYAEKPYPNFILDEDSWSWIPPIPYPDDGKIYQWNEYLYQKDSSVPKTQGWELIE